ncbi:plastocyanin/azurin family copper-binding protein [Candidatus Nitrosopelagicus sp.]|jgi:nitrite reductase (NO-forming)|nr:plastocyanin/azurin family copper-binding protein [Candidatus Nitrosopelagicus sp.]
MAQVQQHDPIYRTTPERTVKMMVIMLGICIVGGGIFFGMWDYWTSMPPPAGLMTGGVGDDHSSGAGSGPVALTGVEINSSLSFIESSDFRTLAFNALPGEADNNPTITANVGDKIIFDVINDGKSFHAFGVTLDTEGFAGIIADSEIASANAPLKPGESGTSEFIPSEPGTYYYICTVPGHRMQGMVGEIIVSGAAAPAAAAPPTGVSHDISFDFVESSDFRTLAFNALPGEEGSNPEIRVNSGDEVTITTVNAGKSFHAFGVVSNPDDFNSVIFDSAIAAATNPLKPGESGEVTFLAGAPGTYYYICTVPGHALQGMQGSFIVE